VLELSKKKGSKKNSINRGRLRKRRGKYEEQERRGLKPIYLKQGPAGRGGARGRARMWGTDNRYETRIVV